jgi:hypothetical protein
MNTTTNPNQGPVILSLICALADGLKKQAEQKSARYNRLEKVEQSAMRAIDYYPGPALDPNVAQKAVQFFDNVESMLDQAFSADQPPSQKDELIKVAAALIKGQLSEHAEDWPKSMPKTALRQIEKQNEQINEIAAQLRIIADKI